MSKIQDLPVVYSYEGNGVTTLFPFGCMIFKLSDIVVYLGDEKQTTGYTVVSNNYDAGGTVTFATAPANGVKITIQRVCDEARLTEYSESGVFRADPTNDEFNHIYALIQDNTEAISRCIKKEVFQDGDANQIFQQFLEDVGEIIETAAESKDIATSAAETAVSSATAAQNYAENVKFGLKREAIVTSDWATSSGKYKIFFADIGIIAAVYKQNGNVYELATNIDIESSDSGTTITALAPFDGFCLIANSINNQYVYRQTSESNHWVIEHNLGKRPHVQCINDDGVVMVGTITHDNLNTLHIDFTENVSGEAILD